MLGACGTSSPATRVAALSAAPARPAAVRPLSRPRHAQASDHRRPSAVLRRLTGRLRRLLLVPGQHVGAYVEDLTTGTVLYDHNGQVARPPASVEKIYTSVAALDLLGAGATFQTTILGTGHRGRRGTWHGNLYLRGGGDPTFGDGTWNRLYMGGYGPTAAQLVAQLRRERIRSVSGWVYGDESLFDSDRGGPATDNRPDTPDYGGELSALVYDHGMSSRRQPPPVFAAHELVLTMAAQGIDARAARRTHRTPAGARTLASVSSPPLAVLLRLMDVPSDDLIADMLTKQLGARFYGTGSLAAGAEEVREDLSDRYGIYPTIFDGSGLDREDATTPAQIVSLLAKISSTPDGSLLRAALPVVGREGTVAGIGTGSYAVGHCVAKTGTLNGVSNLAGYCTTRHGHTLAFALMIDGPPNWTAFASLSRAVGDIAAY